MEPIVIPGDLRLLFGHSVDVDRSKITFVTFNGTDVEHRENGAGSQFADSIVPVRSAFGKDQRKSLSYQPACYIGWQVKHSYNVFVEAGAFRLDSVMPGLASDKPSKGLQVIRWRKRKRFQLVG